VCGQFAVHVGGPPSDTIVDHPVGRRAGKPEAMDDDGGVRIEENPVLFSVRNSEANEYDTTGGAILTSAQNQIQVSLIYRTE